ncbi:MAG: DPP IV N-terminal domain-containing protein, partial [Tidjanibacter sp.]|nr:DPP IV N-terminal domain-containing protein [Tidjanibacter sp.]
MKKHLLVILSTLCMVMGVYAQPKFEYADIASGRFAQKSVYGFNSMLDGEHFTTMSGGAIWRHPYKNHEQKEKLVDLTLLELGGRVADYTFSPDERKIMFCLSSRPLYRRSHFSKYVVYDRVDGTLCAVDESNDVRYALFSPDGQKVAYVKDNNIFINDLAQKFTYQITSDGEWNHVINGMPDWVYEEEWG